MSLSDPHNVVCPKGFASLVTDCPHAPCVDCMDRLKEHMLGELGVLERQSKIAKARLMTSQYWTLGGMMSTIRDTIISALA